MSFLVGAPAEAAVAEAVEVTAKEQVTSPDRVNPFGGGQHNTRAPTKIPAAQLRHWADTSEWVRALCHAACNSPRSWLSDLATALDSVPAARCLRPRPDTWRPPVAVRPVPPKYSVRIAAQLLTPPAILP